MRVGWWWWMLCILVLAACSSPTGRVVIPFEDERQSPATLAIPLEQTKAAREELKQSLAPFGISGVGRRKVYEDFIDRIGVNGILAALHELNPTCHDEAHDLGKVVFARLRAIGPALRACNDGCYSGCMHGVLIEAFAQAAPEGHLSAEDLAPMLPTFCFDERITVLQKPGDCAHGVGHALMFLSDYDINATLSVCSHFADRPMEYYCATGAYMEYNGVHEARDAQNQPLFYPCDTSPFPAACFRYKLTPLLRRLAEKEGLAAVGFVAQKCEELEGFARLGCFHGFGNAHVSHIYEGVFSIKDVCAFGDEQDNVVCVEGAIERLAKYERAAAYRACDDLQGALKDTCLAAAAEDMYRLNKSFGLYFPT